MHEHEDALHNSGNASLSVASILAESARRYPNRTALICASQDTPEERVSYGELWQEALEVAGALIDTGIAPGDRVAMMIPNVPAFARIYYGIMAAGAVVVPIHLQFKRDEIQHVLSDSGAKLLIAAASALEEALPAAATSRVRLASVMVPSEPALKMGVERIEDLADAAQAPDRHVAVNPLAPATLLYTSGTTGVPKGAVHSHLSLVEQAHVALIDMFPMQDNDVIFGGLPLFHTFGQTCVMNTAFRRGASIVLMPRFDASAALAVLCEHEVTVLTAVPTMYVALLRAAQSHPQRPHLRWAISGGAALPLSVLEDFETEFGTQIHEGYGLTETSPVVSFNHVGEPIRPGTVGRSIWGVEAEVADADTEGSITILPPDSLGEIVVRGHNLFKGYLGRPTETAETIVEGWFRTGDLGTKTSDGIITIIDRKKDMIVRNGYNVYPTEVEGILARHSAVQSAAVFGVPHPEHGQEIVAAVVVKDGQIATKTELIDFVKERVAAFKYPREVHFVDSLPLGASGKVLKRALSTQYA